VFARSFFTEQHRTPWGAGANLDMPGSDVVRAFIIDNALHWIREYHLDGLRLDATHALVDHSAVPFVAELTARVHNARAPRPLVYAEDSRNLCVMVEPAGKGGWGLDGVWADDFHHIVRCMLAGDHHGYFEDYAGTSGELAATLRQGWLFTGQQSRHLGRPRGTDPARVPLRSAVICLQNHDQIGNRALGERLHHQVSAAAWRSAVAVLLTAPMTPLLFMGQEWAASTPFLFFSDFEPALGDAVRTGRRREFAAFPAFATAEGAAKIPDPQAAGTFEQSRLRWTERGGAEHAGILSLHRDLLQLRRARTALRGSDELSSMAQALDAGSIAFSRGDGRDRLLVVARLAGDGPVRVDDALNWRTLLSTEDARYGGRPERASFDGAAGVARFEGPGALILERAAHGHAA
jgi:maltooligosyltrehalose trehalohydrolase